MTTPDMTVAPQNVQTAVAGELKERLASRTATIGIVGLGYVGLPMARAVYDAGYPVLGYDIDDAKIEKLGRGENYIEHLGDELDPMLRDTARFQATADATRLAEADAILLCVPTPLGPHREPDLSYVLGSTELVARVLRKGQLIVLTSTTYPGTTRQEMLPILEETGLVCGQDFFLAYSPEREDPGRPGATTASIPKLVGGVDDISVDVAMVLYEQVIERVQRVSSAEVAEASKLLENIYRAVNIAMINEMKVVLTEMGIDVWEVIEAASTKPFGFHAFYPGPGLGGHCIPIDPFYLTWKAKEIGRTTRFIELAGEINAHMRAYVVSRVSFALNQVRKPLRGSRILVIGIAYKPNVAYNRESPAAEIIQLLQARGAEVSYNDPHVPHFPRMRHFDIELSSIPLTKATIGEHDCVLIITDHDGVDYELLGRHAHLIVDSRNAMARVESPAATIVKA